MVLAAFLYGLCRINPLKKNDFSENSDWIFKDARAVDFSIPPKMVTFRYFFIYNVTTLTEGASPCVLPFAN